jgi:ATP-dependent RNA helicase SUPV3L1/SUV3
MSRFSRLPLTAVLGPTNTGKTHLAVERMLGHQTGMMGFPLRLLAREVYDRVVAIKGERAAALVTGEERIWPAGARYLFCTAEAMPREPDPRGFVALDEAQLGQDRERGHVFTSRLLHTRGRDETMILGAASLTGVIRDLLPDADIVTRPRFSTLSYDGPRKLSKLPPRSVIVAFSAEEVYALAEALRRVAGGAAVVMGALSPSTRNAQVAMFQAGEVDYLVATDAIGMGLNLDVSHVAFASLNKFDGVRQRRLTVAEMAQIAGRSGRHQRDGTFGSLGAEAVFTDEEVAAIEEHRFPAIDALYWRNPEPAMDSVAALIAGLEERPEGGRLRAAPEATDLAVLKLLADDAQVVARATDSDRVARLWSACSLPDFTKSGPQAHARLVARLWSDLSSDAGTIDADWFGQRLAALDVAEGSVEVLAERIAKVRTCCYIAQRKDWLADQAEQAEAARAVELRLSDALHAALTSRFVDRRTAVLLRSLGQGAANLPVTVDPASHIVSVDGEAIGTLDGFAFRVEPTARMADRRMLLAAAERHLAGELAQRAMALAGCPDSALSLDLDAARVPGIMWDGTRVAMLVRGRSALTPRVEPIGAIAALDDQLVMVVTSRLQRWVDDRIAALLGPLFAAEATARSPDTAPAQRALLAMLVDGLGVVPRAEVADSIRSLSADQRTAVKRLGVRFGSVTLFFPELLKPAAQVMRAALAAARSGRPPAIPPAQGITFIALEDGVSNTPNASDYVHLGRRRWRIDMVEKVAEHAHAARARAIAALEEQVNANAADAANAPSPATIAFPIDPAFPMSLGLVDVEQRRVLEMLGFVRVGTAATLAEQLWRFRGVRAKPAPGTRPAQRRGRDDTAKGGRRRDALAAAASLSVRGGRKNGGPAQDSAAQPAVAKAKHAATDHSPFAVLSGLFAPAATSSTPTPAPSPSPTPSAVPDGAAPEG